MKKKISALFWSVVVYAVLSGIFFPGIIFRKAHPPVLGYDDMLRVKIHRYKIIRKRLPSDLVVDLGEWMKTYPPANPIIIEYGERENEYIIDGKYVYRYDKESPSLIYHDSLEEYNRLSRAFKKMSLGYWGCVSIFGFAFFAWKKRLARRYPQLSSTSNTGD